MTERCDHQLPYCNYESEADDDADMDLVALQVLYIHVHEFVREFLPSFDESRSAIALVFS